MAADGVSFATEVQQMELANPEGLAGASSAVLLTHSCCVRLWRADVFFPKMRHCCSSQLNESDLILWSLKKTNLVWVYIEGIKENKAN